ncbi:MAG TPA: DUF4132 domain-containing protein [Candidatus Xenobia bacterium]|jgi:predicted DNA-binding WGR domain protein
MRRFEFSEGTSNKFWEADIAGSTLSVRWGRIGTAGQGKDKAFPSPDRAQAEFDKLVREKLKEGYREVGAPAVAAPTPAAKPPAMAVLEKPEPQSVLVEAAGSDAIDPVVWTAAGRAHLPPRRPAPLPSLPLADRVERFRRAIVSLLASQHNIQYPRQIETVVACLARMAPAAQAATRHLEALLGSSPDLPRLDAEALAAQAALLALNDLRYVLADVRQAAGEQFVGYWAQVASPRVVVEALLRARGWVLRSGLAPTTVHWVEPGTGAQPTGPWDPLRRVLAGCPEPVYQEAVAWAAAHRPTAPLEDRLVLDFLFPDQADWARADLPEALLQAPRSAALLLTSLDDPKLALQLFTQLATYPKLVKEYAWQALAAIGADCAPILMRAQGLYDPAPAFRALACIRTPEVADFFAGQPGGKTEREIGYGYLTSVPRLSIPALLPKAHQEEPRRLLKTILNRHPDIADQLPLTPEQRAVLTALQPTTRDLPAASPDVLPEVLRNPPWLRGRKPRPALIKGLTPPERLERVVLRESDPQTLKEPIRIRQDGKQLDVKPLGDDVLLSSLTTQFPYGPLHLYALQRLGMRAVPALLAHIEKRSVMAARAWDLLTRVDALSICPLMVDAYARLKRGREVGADWLSRFPDTAAAGVIPLAVGSGGATRQHAIAALQFVAEAHRDLVLKTADSYGSEVRKAVDLLLADDANEACPERMPKLPDTWWTPAAWHKPLLRDRQTALPASVIDTIGLMLATSTPENRYAGLDQVKAVCDPESLDAFAWDVFSAWLAANAPAKEQWALLALGHLGGDNSARRLTPLIREWPGQAVSARAFLGLDVLALIGTDVALMHLHGIAQRVKFKGLQEKAREKIADIAEARNLSSEELADRLVPDLGLDASGATVLDFGPRQFRVAFDEALRPYVTDAAGKRLSDLPKPGKAESEEALTRWKNLKRDVRTIASDQILRLELACIGQRRWDAAPFKTFFVQHPLVFHLASRLVWGVFDHEHLVDTFRVAEDRTLATVEDEPFELPDGAVVGLPHPLEAPPELFVRWGQVFGDYEILQPFQQLERPTYTATKEESTAASLQRAEGLTVPFNVVLGLVKRGWRRGPAEDGGVSGEMVKALPNGREAALHLNPGLFNGMIAESGDQTLEGLTIRTAGTWERGTHLGVLSPVTFSELVADVVSLKP